MSPRTFLMGESPLAHHTGCSKPNQRSCTPELVPKRREKRMISFSGATKSSKMKGFSSKNAAAKIHALNVEGDERKGDESQDWISTTTASTTQTGKSIALGQSLRSPNKPASPRPPKLDGPVDPPTENPVPLPPAEKLVVALPLEFGENLRETAHSNRRYSDMPQYQADDATPTAAGITSDKAGTFLMSSTDTGLDAGLRNQGTHLSLDTAAMNRTSQTSEVPRSSGTPSNGTPPSFSRKDSMFREKRKQQECRQLEKVFSVSHVRSQ